MTHSREKKSHLFGRSSIFLLNASRATGAGEGGAGPALDGAIGFPF